MMLQPGSGSLSLTFLGELNNKMKGFYRSKYKGCDGDERYGAVSQFEVSTKAVTGMRVGTSGIYRWGWGWGWGGCI